MVATASTLSGRPNLVSQTHRSCMSLGVYLGQGHLDKAFVAVPRQSSLGDRRHTHVVCCKVAVMTLVSALLLVCVVEVGAVERSQLDNATVALFSAGSVEDVWREESERDPNRQPRSPPEYFFHLYRSILRGEGRFSPTALHFANQVTGYFDEAGRSQAHYLFNVNPISRDVNILAANLHLYRMPHRNALRFFRNQKMNRSLSPTRHIGGFIFIKLHLIQEQDGHTNLLPIDARRIPAALRGWIVFDVHTAVEYWRQNPPHLNKGLFLVAERRNGYPASSSSKGVFIQRSDYLDHMQPFLVVYIHIEDSSSNIQNVIKQKIMAPGYESNAPNLYENMYNRKIYTEYEPDSPTRKPYAVFQGSSKSQKRFRRDSTKTYARRQRPRHKNSPARSAGSTGHCSRHPMLVHFAKIGWDKWIVSPSNFNAYRCSGLCPFPLGHEYRPTNHAVLQAIWQHVSRPAGSRTGPCCVPHELGSLPLLYYEDENRLVLKQYEGMVVNSCGCK